jgi:DNA topoisomerase-1
MAPNLVIVESASKAKSIQKYLNAAPELAHLGEFKVLASLGHVEDLPLKEMGVDVKTWDVTYVPIPNKAKTLKALKKAAKESKCVYLASDPDREGAAIAKHLQTVLRLPKDAPRLVFHEITPKALTHAVLHPGRIDESMVAAQETRRVLDRVVGYETSPLLWRRFSTGSLSAGRVQTAALQMLVARSKAQEAHECVPVWTLEADFQLASEEPVKTKGIYLDGGHTLEYTESSDVQALMAHLAKNAIKKNNVWTAVFTQKPVSKSPPPPFTTSTLQQEAYNRYSFEAKRTMQLAQTLYEIGLITYMRTDSVTLSKDAQGEILGHVKAEFGEEDAQARQFKTKTVNAQEAHEAIRPTKVQMDVAVAKEEFSGAENLTAAHWKLYDLIWRRTVASQMAPAKYVEVSVTVTSKVLPEGIAFRGVTSIMTEPGYLKVYAVAASAKGAESASAALAKWAPFLAKGTAPMTPLTFAANGDVKRPPSQYNEPQLVKALEKRGIGRPSTFATILDKIQGRGYVCKGANPQSSHETSSFTVDPKAKTVTTTKGVLIVGGKETDCMLPTNLGKRVSGYLETAVPLLVDMEFTARMEADLDRIATGAVKQKDVLDEFYRDFRPHIEAAIAEQKVAAKSEVVDGVVAKVKGAKAVKAVKGKKGAAVFDATSKPKNALREFPAHDAYVLQTKFGLAILHAETKRFVSLAPFLEWRKTTPPALTDKDVRFLLALPLAHSSGGQVHIGRYGLYLKGVAGKNERNDKLDRAEWDAIYDAFV